EIQCARVSATALAQSRRRRCDGSRASRSTGRLRHEHGDRGAAVRRPTAGSTILEAPAEPSMKRAAVQRKFIGSVETALMRVLIVEDDRRLAAALRRGLLREGF